ncbi:MAG: alpha/beta hydrolase [Myxococcota bacterium]
MLQLILPLAVTVSTPDLDWQPCRLEAQPFLPTERAECTTVVVPVNYDEPDGKTIELFVAKVPSLAATSRPDPLVLIAGGPGQSTEEYYMVARGAFSRVRLKRDIIIVDQRGTGKSARMDCPEQEDAEFEELSDERIEAAVKSCLDQLPHDPRYFTTSVAVDDLDRVRAALGVKNWNVFGISYGTRVGLHYLNEYPDSVRSLIIDGVAGRDRVLGPDIALRSQETVEAIFARCKADAGCSKTVGDPGAHLQSILRKLKDGPVTASILDPETGRPERVDFDLNTFRGVLRLLAYSPDRQASIPVLLYEAAVKKNFGPLAAFGVRLSEDMASTFAYGMHNSVVCSEDAPSFKRTPELEAALESTYLGAELMEFMGAACRYWPVGVVDDDIRSPISATNPVLLISGELDPITPPADAEALAQTLKNATHIVAGAQGHGVAATGCMPRLMNEFIDAPEKPLDAECIKRAGPFPLAIDVNGPTP